MAESTCTFVYVVWRVDAVEDSVVNAIVRNSVLLSASLMSLAAPSDI